jgi:hypothetical protein
LDRVHMMEQYGGDAAVSPLQSLLGEVGAGYFHLLMSGISKQIEQSSYPLQLLRRVPALIECQHAVSDAAKGVGPESNKTPQRQLLQVSGSSNTCIMRSIPLEQSCRTLQE